MSNDPIKRKWEFQNQTMDEANGDILEYLRIIHQKGMAAAKEHHFSIKFSSPNNKLEPSIKSDRVHPRK